MNDMYKIAVLYNDSCHWCNDFINNDWPLIYPAMVQYVSPVIPLDFCFYQAGSPSCIEYENRLGLSGYPSIVFYKNIDGIIKEIEYDQGRDWSHLLGAFLDFAEQDKSILDGKDVKADEAGAKSYFETKSAAAGGSNCSNTNIEGYEHCGGKQLLNLRPLQTLQPYSLNYNKSYYNKYLKYKSKYLDLKNKLKKLEKEKK